MKRIGIVEYGVGNISSVSNALNYLGADFKHCRFPRDFQDISGIILPGVGSFPSGMNNLQQNDLIGILKDTVSGGVPVLGICLGMQLLGNSSEEFGITKGLGFIDGAISPLDNRNGSLRIPHIGWNEVAFKESILTKGLGQKDSFYFVHSFGFDDPDAPYVTGVCNYGSNVVSIVESDNVFGVQFHPEKSQKSGLKILENFLSL